jgi:hypothetical protein
MEGGRGVGRRRGRRRAWGDGAMTHARRALCAVFGHTHAGGEVTCRRCGGVDPERARKLKEASAASAAALAAPEPRAPAGREHGARRAARGARAERTPRAEVEPVREPPPG